MLTLKGLCADTPLGVGLEQRPSSNKKLLELQGWSAKFPGGEPELPGSSPSSVLPSPSPSCFPQPSASPMEKASTGRLRNCLTALSEPPRLRPSKDCNFLPAESEPHLTLVSQDLSSKELQILASRIAASGQSTGHKNGKIYS